MSEQRWVGKGYQLEGTAAGSYSVLFDVWAGNIVFQCVRCKHTEKLDVCSNCSNRQFTGGYSTDGVVGLVCIKCRLGQTRWLCPKCETNNSVITSFGKLESGNCFIATTAFEGTQVPEVVFLRGFRDNTLANYKLGRGLISVYQKISPPLANIVSRSKTLKRISRSVLRIIIKVLPK